MSRIGKKAITISSGVSVKRDANLITVTGPLGTLSREIHPAFNLETEDNIMRVTTSDATQKALFGLTRQLIANMVEGVSKGFQKSLNINGVGFKVTQQGQDLVMNIGFSNPVTIKSVDGITLSCEKTVIHVKGIDKELVGRFASNIRSIKPVEPYHAYGISYTDEVIVRKEVKSGKK